MPEQSIITDGAAAPAAPEVASTTDAATARDLGPIVVLAGGLSHERDVSLRSGRRVSQALRDRGHHVIESDVNSGLVGMLQSLDNPVVIPVVHGMTGEDGSLREVLGLLGVRFVGSTASASRIAFDKSIATPVIASTGIATPTQIALPDEVFRELGAQALIEAMEQAIGFPMMVKPARGGSALGCTQVHSPDELASALVSAYAYGPTAVVESYVEGTEVAVTVIDRGDGPEALPVVEIRPDSGIYDYSSRYVAGSTRFLTPADLAPEVSRACAELAVAVHERLGLRDISRTDIIIADGEPVFIETNVAPGMTETSLVPLAIQGAGWDIGDVCEDLVRKARAR